MTDNPSACHPKNQESIPGVTGGPLSTKSAILETGASLTQDFAPVKNICAHLNAFHVYASDPTRAPVETNHYCGHLTEDVRQCILYDSPGPNARILGIEYMISPQLYSTLESEEKRLWHSHVFEVKSGMLIMPQPNPLVPLAAWEKAENAEMEQVVELYGKIFHLWQVDRGDKIPLGRPELMTSLTEASQWPGGGEAAMEKALDERDARFPGQGGWRRKKENRAYIKEPEIHPGEL